MIQVDKKANCCGCTACKNICPVQAIEMIEDEEGFLYPTIDEKKCIKCGLCDKTCPILNKLEKESFEQKAYVINNKNDGERLQSTSGGAFSPIAEYVLDRDGVVFGAIIDEKQEVYHKYIENKSDLKGFRGSKYVQSNLKETFKEVWSFLQSDRYVCFSGTPCQIQGLRKFLKKDYEKLITVDFVCRAVPSPLVLRKYLEYEKNKNHMKNIKQVIFRDKQKYGYKYSTMTLKSEDKIYQMGVESDPYLRAFFKNYSDRPSCYECHFRDKDRVSDFTLWDCFTIREFSQKLDDNKGTTRMIVQSTKGRKVFEEIKEKYKFEEIPIDKAVENVRELKESVTPNVQREDFFKDINKLEAEEFFKKYFPDSFKVKLERNVRKILVKTQFYDNLKNKIKRIIKKG